ncbi:MAG: hypothetical protein Q7U39_00530 [Nitrospira sp.]|nr:hypothetical protein [Nitrospira sp.]
MSASQPTSATVAIHRLGAEATLVWSASAWVPPKAIPPDASERGCGWDDGESGQVSFEVPAGWSSGFYRITMSPSSSDGRARDGEAFFVVRAPDSVPQVSTLLLVSTNTYGAYNNYGASTAAGIVTTRGGFYDQAREVSFHRPLPAGFLSPYDCRRSHDPSRQSPYAGWDKWEWPFVQWAERNKIVLDYATNEDLERDPGLLSRYRLVLSVGHDEYWSMGMRGALDRYIRAGGNAAFFSGNVCYRNVRLDLAGSRLILEGDMDGVALWSHRDGPNQPENRLTGVSFCYGALRPDPIPYTIYHPKHWMFEGLWPGGYRPGQFPLVGCIGYECDGCDIEWAGGVPAASHRDGTPANFQILGLAPGRMPDYEATVHSNALFGRGDGFTPWGRDLRQGAAVLGLWADGGTVVTVGCTEWARHLDDPLVTQITRNIIRRLAS